ncbi:MULTISPECIES: CS1 type fimbrial major subunit [unclassified Pseudomonas]|uniref:CS1 type fimbrial major subunit n=1 Tax=unclassified Pseudomonas TaxID=196821 RepID=UPI00119B60C1|nr:MULTISPECIES: CS1 type fimbrial major subunit [unclassified Pseudomonas]TWC20388.1 CS1 type fimbrial major subunit [Pseudomonas sp. SJZ075]TWC25733.1 CS1 type fimbrial major subunit [Pseudomonas sp. SJZ074]TWC35818.1 CS1 type fimbrial major subunit [Pseudomonas sp. SJZ078]TWC42544.1 CS1 type fimbrial major subunit [Pseudomonas sp. SJZ085]TWC56686.1 CS1 type fimbrial major subunit [Pseudomonas sp. SJZ124]
MLMKIVTAATLTTAALSSSLAFAADDARSSIHITANIPTEQFHVQPRDGNWGKDETMTYNTVSGTLTSLRQTYDVKNTVGSVNAYIEGGPASLYNGSDAIALTTTFNGVTLTAMSQEVVDDATSTPGTQAEMVILPAKPLNTQNGLYTADMTVIFDAVPRP